jgi:peptidoglycan/xylan/chitin deacetylase (PgdA/CDA1 family)
VRSPLNLYDWCFLDRDSFRSQLIYLKKHFDVIPLFVAVEAIRDGTLNRPTAVITFDDGYQNNYSVAFPILRELALPATIFLTTGFIDTDDTFWNLRLNLSLTNTNQTALPWNGKALDLSNAAARAKANVIIRRSLRDLPRAELMARMRRIIASLGEDPNKPIESHSPFRMLSRRAVEEMGDSKLVEFGAHSHTHPILARLSSEECKAEIEMSIRRVEELTGQACRCFAYPLGGREDYNQQTIDIVRRLGITAAVTAIPGPNDDKVSVLELRRYGAGPGDSMPAFQLTVHHMNAPGVLLSQRR